MTGACYFTLVNLLSLTLLFTSIPACWTRLKHPDRAACVAKETCFTLRQGWCLVQVTPVCRFLKQYWWQPWSICRLCSALLNLSQLIFGLCKQWRQDMLKAGEKYIFIAALYLHFIAKRLPLMQSFAAGAFPLVPKGKSLCGRGEGAQMFLMEEIAALTFHMSKNRTLQLRWPNAVSKHLSVIHYNFQTFFFFEKKTLCHMVPPHTVFLTAKLFCLNKILVV